MEPFTFEFRVVATRGVGFNVRTVEVCRVRATTPADAVARAQRGGWSDATRAYPVDPDMYSNDRIIRAYL